ncbi:unnamed protein product [Chironomus riparius]|uniref:Uncharacterized protein n=1 Tax=Chironomus riparius TaxID=315576 RepID=A0A9N9WXK3_9DIPT|nr:unnamed protein product [Chironomus riparius]
MNENQNYSSYAITVNLVQFISVDEMKVYKIYYNFNEVALKTDDMEKLYKQVYEYVNKNFIRNDETKIFLGCVRDDSGTHKKMNFTKLDLAYRTDPIHDIFNVLKNIYINNGLSYVGKKNKMKRTISKSDLSAFIETIEPKMRSALPIVGYFDPKTLSAEECAKRIWIPNQEYKLEGFIVPLKHLFSINYYEKLLDIVGKKSKTKKETEINTKARRLLKFIVLLKKILNFQYELISDENFNEYEKFLSELSAYDFQNELIRCLKSLKGTIKTNIKFFKKHKTPFKPIWFSTQMIEAEKGSLRYQSCNATPTIDECVNWFERSIEGGVDEVGYSEFGQCRLKFDSLPNEISRIIDAKTDAETDAETDAKTDAETDANKDAETDAKTDAESEDLCENLENLKVD